MFVLPCFQVIAKTLLKLESNPQSKDQKTPRTRNACIDGAFSVAGITDSTEQTKKPN
jgi:hypothetical protein